MMPAFRKIVSATTRPLRMVRLEPLLRAAGLETEPLAMSPQQ
jgi:hypothetical protein